ncbi:hydrolase 2, exosortase A system-associated [Undibacterium sp. RuTC16W]|uniref:hydrolase 2, exosortase A system-associated n=1 Tax=Undibacterium sp. RuTC16W TaxID=3413048 RepID=UPI003BF182E3
MLSVAASSAESFFLDTSSGYRFCLYFSPKKDKPCLGGIVYLHPFAEEMNKSRKMAAMQARRLAVSGYGVLIIDLFGCGDSSGELKDASWSIWKQDVQDAINWMRARLKAPISLWGLRLGALLALDMVQSTENPVEKIALWQPVLQGTSFLNQFFRLRLAGDMLTEKNPSSTQPSVRTLLDQGQIVEIAGYEISHALAASIDALDASGWHFGASDLHWLECPSENSTALPFARQKILTGWMEKGTHINIQMVSGHPFWMSQETTVNTDLVDATTGIFRQP